MKSFTSSPQLVYSFALLQSHGPAAPSGDTWAFNNLRGFTCRTFRVAICSLLDWPFLLLLSFRVQHGRTRPLSWRASPSPVLLKRWVRSRRASSYLSLIH